MSVSNSIDSTFQSHLARWISTNAFNQALKNAFGSVATDNEILRMRDLLMYPTNSGFPRIIELSPEYLNNHFAAYSAETNTVYVDPDLKTFPGLAESVLAHELGHWADNQLNGELIAHNSVRKFADTIIGRLRDNDDAKYSQQQINEAQKLKLPSGEVINAQYFDTDLHVSWITEQLPFLSVTAARMIANGQEDTDWFFSKKTMPVGLLKYSPYGLQTHTPSHFDNNNISGGLAAIRSRWKDGILRFNESEIPEVTSEQFLGKNQIDALANPLFSSSFAGIQLLLYRFGQINHAFEDFYSHSNWVELVKNNLIGSTELLEGKLDFPSVLQPGSQIPNTSVFVAQSGGLGHNSLKKSGTGTYSGFNYDVYWNVNSTLTSKGGGVVSATTIDGKKIYGLATGAVNGAVYKDKDYSEFLRDPTKTGFFQKEYFRGFDHGGIAGTMILFGGQWVGPLNKDSNKHNDFLAAKKLANLQLQNEWNRMGNLIFKNHGVDGLLKFASFALSTQEARDNYVVTFSKSEGRYFESPSELNLYNASILLIPETEINDNFITANVPKFRLVRLYGDKTLNSLNLFNNYQDRYQYLDPATSLWLDTDFNDISIHHELDSDDIANLSIPSLIQHASRGERAVWSQMSEYSIGRSGTNYFVELINADVNIYIDNFDVKHDRIIFIDSAGMEVILPENLYSITTVEQLIAQLAKYRVLLNFRPLIELTPGAVLIKESQLASPVLIKASTIANDVMAEDLFFTSYDDSIPFLKLVDGALRATSIDPKYAGNTYTGYVDISDGTSISRSVPVRVAIAPKLMINGETFDSDAIFKLKISKLTSQSFDIIIQIKDHLDNTLDQFLTIATSIGSLSGVPNGYNSMDLITNLSDKLDSGNVSFWLRDGSGELLPLNATIPEKGVFNLLLDGAQIAQLSPHTGNLATPAISIISHPEVLGDGLGLRLNQEFFDITSRDVSTPWIVTLKMDLYREAAYYSQVGLFLYDTVSADIIDPITGFSLGKPNSTWIESAELYSVWIGQTDNMKSTNFSTVFEINGQIDPDSVALMPFMKTQIDGSSAYFSTFDSLNIDGARHIAEISRNTFGFEDMIGLGDNDLDDMILQINYFTLK